uniref:Uncharacterized protein n=1 Tax=Megaselia scalaris TaxID=36166 RepID=T1GH22_MEGSC
MNRKIFHYKNAGAESFEKKKDSFVSSNFERSIGNQANFNYEGINSEDMDAPSQDLFENSSSNSKKIKNLLEITKNQEIYDDFGLISNREMDAPLQTLFEDSTSKTAALESSENLTLGQMDENFEEASVVIFVTSYLDMVSKIENLRAIQVNQYSTVEDIKAILARERVENSKILTEMKDMKQDIKILLVVLEWANENTNEDVLGFKLHLSTVEDLNRMEEELEQNLDFKSALLYQHPDVAKKIRSKAGHVEKMEPRDNQLET